MGSHYRELQVPKKKRRTGHLAKGRAAVRSLCEPTSGQIAFGVGLYLSVPTQPPGQRHRHAGRARFLGGLHHSQPKKTDEVLEMSEQASRLIRWFGPSIPRFDGVGERAVCAGDVPAFLVSEADYPALRRTGHASFPNGK